MNTTEPKLTSSRQLRSFLIAFLFPTLMGKGLLLFFGLNYSRFPGEGYGYGLIASLIFLTFMIGRFLYKNWDKEDF